MVFKWIVPFCCASSKIAAFIVVDVIILKKSQFCFFTSFVSWKIPNKRKCGIFSHIHMTRSCLLIASVLSIGLVYNLRTFWPLSKEKKTKQIFSSLCRTCKVESFYTISFAPPQNTFYLTLLMSSFAKGLYRCWWLVMVVLVQLLFLTYSFFSLYVFKYRPKRWRWLFISTRKKSKRKIFETHYTHTFFGDIHT